MFCKIYLYASRRNKQKTTHDFMILRRKMSTTQIKISSSKDTRIWSIIINRSIMLQILNIKKSVSNRTVTIIKNLNKKKDSTLAILIRILKKKTLSNFLSLMQLNTYRKIVVSKYRLEKMRKIKALVLQ